MAHRRVRVTLPDGHELIYRLVRDFDIVVNVRPAEGSVLLELDGGDEAIERGIAWLLAQGATDVAT